MGPGQPPGGLQQRGRLHLQGDGLRMSKTVGAATTLQTWDLSGGLTTLTEEVVPALAQAS